MCFQPFIFVVTLLSLIMGSVATATEIRQGPFIPPGTSTINGRFLLENGEPLTDGIAAVFGADHPYPLEFGNLHRIPDYVAPVDEEGRFTMVLAAGRFYLGVIVKDDPAGTGPPEPADRTFSAVEEENKRKIFEIQRGIDKNLGDIQVASLKTDEEISDFFTIHGKILNREGKPFETAWIMVRRNRQAKRPDFISKKITDDGQFTLHLPAGGPYFLIAKSVPGIGRPQAGSFVGAYTGPNPVFDQNMPEPKPQPLSGSAGDTLAHIQIVMIEVPDAELRKATMQGHPDQKIFQPMIAPPIEGE